MEFYGDPQDIKFLLFDALPIDKILSSPAFASWGKEDLSMVIDSAAKIAKGELARVNEIGDREGCQYENEQVRVPQAFHEAYRKMAEGGWLGSTGSMESGGMGLPQMVSTSVDELFFSSNVCFSLVVLLTRGCAHLIETFGSEELKSLYCEKMYAGTWAGTMCLTESSAGSDVGASKCKAVKEGDRYRLDGEKIFITFGEHDLTENTIHAVLARTPDAPAGVKGLSLFVVPKKRIENGELVDNDVHCTGIEHKMGINGSPTCTMYFGANGKCYGHILGQEQQGIRLMFHLMNEARLEVGVQGVGVAQAGFRAALDYAKERLQSRHWTGQGPAQVPIVEHPDVRRMLLFQKAQVEALRALILTTAFHVDMAKTAEDEATRAYHQSYVEFYTPICKAYGSDMGFRVNESALQVFGGYGYLKDYPAEQLLRDSKIASIYEGTNGIQALDLVGRKLGARKGEVVRNIFGQIAQAVEQYSGHEVFAPVAARLGEALASVQRSTMVFAAGGRESVIPHLNAVPFLEMMGHLICASLLVQYADKALSKLQAMASEAGVDLKDDAARQAYLEKNATAAFLDGKVQSALFFGARVLPQATALSQAIENEDVSAMRVVF